MKLAKIEDLHCDAGWRTFSFLKLTTDDGLVGWSEYTEADGSRGLTARDPRPRRTADRPGPAAGAADRLDAVGAPGAGAGRGQLARHRGDRERAARHQGQGARRAGVRAVRRPGARAHPGLLVALRLLPRAQPRAGGRAAAAHLRRHRGAGRRGEAARLQGAEDQHPAVRRREADQLRSRLRPLAGLAGAERRPQDAAGGARSARRVPRRRRSGDGAASRRATTTSRPRAICRSPRRSRRST